MQGGQLLLGTRADVLLGDNLLKHILQGEYRLMSELLLKSIWGLRVAQSVESIKARIVAVKQVLLVN